MRIVGTAAGLGGGANWRASAGSSTIVKFPDLVETCNTFGVRNAPTTT